MKGCETMQKAKPVNLKTGKSRTDVTQKRKEVEVALKGSQTLSKKPPNSLCDKGKLIYRDILQSFPEGFFNKIDSHVIATVADSLAQMDRIRHEINQLSPLEASETKLIISYQKYCDVLKKYINEIGISPVSRSQLANLISKEKETVSDPLLKILHGGK
jgi:phage terminase small subunit